MLSEEIIRVVTSLVIQEHRDTFTDDHIREKLKVDQERWETTYYPVLLGMKTDRPAAAPDSGARYRNVFVQIRPHEYVLSAYGKELVEAIRRAPRSQDTVELNRMDETHSETMDGLRAWQAATVRLWSASEDAFAELVVSWLPGSVEGAPWTARLYCGDKTEPGWVEDVRVISTASVQQALQRLWDRAKVRHGLFKDDPALTSKVPTDFPSDLWLTVAERAQLEKLIAVVRRTHTDSAIRLSNHPDRRLSARWTALLHKVSAEPPEGVQHEVHAASLLHAADALYKAIEAALLQALENTQRFDLETRALVQRDTDTAIEPIAPPTTLPNEKKQDE